MPLDVIQDRGFPHVLVGEETRALPWTLGTMRVSRMLASFVRLSQRGFTVSMGELDRQAIDYANWKQTPCVTTKRAFCEQPNGKVWWFANGVVDVPDDWEQLMQDEKIVELARQAGSCKRSDSARVLASTDVRYEVSLCDLLDLKLDIILDIDMEMLYWRQENVSLAEYICLALVTVYLVSVVCENVVTMLQKGSTLQEQTSKLENAVLITLCGYLTWFVAWSVDNGLVVKQDRRVAVHLLVFYVCNLTGEVALWLSALWLSEAQDLSQELDKILLGRRISMLSASLLLVSARVYGSFDNTFSFGLAVFFAWRTVVKLLGVLQASQQKATWKGWVLSRALVLLDALMASSLLGNTLAPGLVSTALECSQALLCVLAVEFGTLAAWHAQDSQIEK